jgi:hypothetical protein
MLQALTAARIDPIPTSTIVAARMRSPRKSIILNDPLKALKAAATRKGLQPLLIPNECAEMNSPDD